MGLSSSKRNHHFLYCGNDFQGLSLVFCLFFQGPTGGGSLPQFRGSCNRQECPGGFGPKSGNSSETRLVVGGWWLVSWVVHKRLFRVCVYIYIYVICDYTYIYIFIYLHIIHIYVMYTEYIIYIYIYIYARSSNHLFVLNDSYDNLVRAATWTT